MCEWVDELYTNTGHLCGFFSIPTVGFYFQLLFCFVCLASVFCLFEYSEEVFVDETVKHRINSISDHRLWTSATHLVGNNRIQQTLKKRHNKLAFHVYL